MSKWTKEQEQAITEVGKNIIVSAGAGSGKTAVLTERTIRKLLNGGSISRLLILTFTNAAAGEMKDRIRRAIKKSGLKDQLDLIDSAYITTFDSFAMTVVKKYSEALKISPNITVMDSSIELLKSKEILDKIFEESYDDNKFRKLINDFCIKTDDNMKSIIKNISNKLDLLPQKQDYLDSYIETHYNINFIENKKQEYVNYIIDLKNEIIPLYDKLSNYVDDKFLNAYNLIPLINSDTYSDIKTNIDLIGSPRKNKNCDDNYKYYKDEIKIILDKMSDLVRFDSEEDIINSYMQTKDYLEAIIDIIKKYDQCFKEYKDKTNMYTFNDIALMAIKVIKENSYIREELINSFDEIMVDEYQDTSDIQEEFINLISNNNIYMVGDIKQSIYRFRHANPYIFRNKYDSYSKNLGGIKIDLLKNFRSRSEVLDNINLIFNLIMDNELGDADYKESHQMNFGNTKYINEWNTNQDNNMDILYYDKDNTRDYSPDEVEAFIVAQDIKNKLDNKYLVVDNETSTLRPCTYKDFSIIMDRGTSFDLYKKIFEYLGIPIVQIANTTLTNDYDIVALASLIKLIVKVNLNEIDDEFKYLYVSVSRSYLFRIDDNQIFDIVENNKFKNTKLYEMCKNINIFELSNLDLLNKVINDFKLYEKLITIGSIKDSMIKIDYLKDLSINLSRVGYTPIMFSNYLSNMITFGDIEYSLNTGNSNSVKILNIHKSKGLEYNICYFTGLSKKSNDEDKKARFLVDNNYDIIVPYINNGINNTILKDILLDSENRESISEKIRLFYVALTRTKEKMIMVLPKPKENISYTTKVPLNTRLKFNRLSDMLDCIKDVIEPYSKEIDLNKINLTKDYEKIKEYNYKKEIKKVDDKIIKHENNISYEEISTDRYSKVSNKLITLDQYNNMKKGIELHEMFEMEDFKNTSNKYVQRFLKNIDMNYINCFKEYEFIIETESEERHGIIDLMLEYDDHIDIIDYKMKNINDLEYLKQLKGYQEYIKTKTNKPIKIYLYSIIDEFLKEL